MKTSESEDGDKKFNYSTCRRADIYKWTRRIAAENIKLQATQSQK